MEIRLGKGNKNIITTSRLKQSEIFIQVTRVFFEIFYIVKLDRIDKNAANRDVVGFPGFFDQRKMSFVQGAHGRDKSNRVPGLVFLLHGLYHFADQ